MEQVIIRVLDFTEDPGPRYIRQDKEGAMTSGEAFYLEVLNKVFTTCYKEGKHLVLSLDGVSGYPSSFLDEAIGELVYDFTQEVVSERLHFETRFFKRRVSQVVEETYAQWNQRRKDKDVVVHSPNLKYMVHTLLDNGELKERNIYDRI